MKKAALFAIFSLFLTACTSEEGTPRRVATVSMKQFSHTATSSCQHNGGKAQTRHMNGKQQEICSFPNGKVVGEWRPIRKS